MRQLVSLSLACLLGSLTALSAHAAVLHVPAQYPTISAAVAAANAGDKIMVEEGIYANETHTTPIDPTVQVAGINIDKPDLEIVGEEGAIVDGTAFGGASVIATNGVTVMPLNVTIRGLTIRNFGTGIAELGPAGTRIQANTITNCSVGIMVSSGTEVDSNVPAPARSTVDHNIVTDNGLGLWVSSSQNVNATHNVVNGNGEGIAVGEGSISCTISHNAVCNNQQDGINLSFSTNILVSDNTVDNNGLGYPAGNSYGIFTAGININTIAMNCMIFNNEVNGNTQDGIFIDSMFSTGNVVTNNTALHNGIYDIEDQSGGTNVLSRNKFVTSAP